MRLAEEVFTNETFLNYFQHLISDRFGSVVYYWWERWFLQV